MTPLNDACRGDCWALRKSSDSCLKRDSDSTSPHLGLELAKGHPSHPLLPSLTTLSSWKQLSRIQNTSPKPCPTQDQGWGPSKGWALPRSSVPGPRRPPCPLRGSSSPICCGREPATA